MAEIIRLDDYRAVKPAERALFGRAKITYDLLHGPITDEIVDALESLSDAELEAFFRARARAKLQIEKATV